MKCSLYVCEHVDDESGTRWGFFTTTQSEALQWARTTSAAEHDRVSVQEWKIQGPPRECMERACALAQIGDAVEGGPEAANTPACTWSIGREWKRSGDQVRLVKAGEA